MRAASVPSSKAGAVSNAPALLGSHQLPAVRSNSACCETIMSVLVDDRIAARRGLVSIEGDGQRPECMCAATGHKRAVDIAIDKRGNL